MLQERPIHPNDRPSLAMGTAVDRVSDGVVSLLASEGFNLTFVENGDGRSNGADAEAGQPTIVLVADDVQGTWGLVSRLLDASPQSRVVIVGDPPGRREGYGSASAGTEQHASRWSVLRGGRGPRVTVRRQGRESPATDRPNGTAALTFREVAVLRLIARGESNRRIGEELSISEHTVRAHARSIMQKLAVKNRIEAAAVALRSGLAG